MPSIEVSCPFCGQTVPVEMSPYKMPEGGIGAMFEDMVGEIGIKHYCYQGKRNCRCGKTVDVSVNIVGQ